MKTTHTHKGHCQVCGAMHAVDNSHNGLAKHGYDVSWGFFNGVCSGADNLPIQLDRTLADKTIASLDKKIASLQTSLDSVNDWFPETVYGYKLDGKFVELPSIYNMFHSYDVLKDMSLSPQDYMVRRYKKYVEQGYISVTLTFSEFQLTANDVDYKTPARYLQSWREARARRLKNTQAQAEGHKYFLQELIEKFYGKPLIESNLVSKVVKELSEIASADILNEEPTIEIKTNWNGIEYKVRKFSVWKSEAEKEINGRTLKVLCKRNSTYKKFTAYTYVDGKKVGKKALEELLG
jgi:hypothetical protein